ncbi:MAG TPA: AprI/Inh family metalloprotease inhibitor [Pseudolabrys sp.]|nr:AprI/Inh family metalloprotease inhibitor [Pseudolabrys sp.]
MTRFAAVFIAVACIAGAALAQAPSPLGESAQRMIGSWEFSNADRDRTCTATFKGDRAPPGLKVEFDANCVNLFPLVRDIAAWKFPDNDLLYLLDAKGKSVVEFSEVEDGIFEAPTPGVGVLFLQNAAAGAPPRPPEQITGDWAIVRKSGSPVCILTLAMSKANDGFAVAVKPGCDAAIARLNFTQWRIDSDQLMLVPARGNPWRFEEVDNTIWRRVPESADQITLVRQ